MGSKKINRLTVYTTGETIKANEHNAEHQQYIDNFNELFKSFDYDGVFHYPLASKVKFEYTDLKLEDLLKVAINPDGTVKIDKVVSPDWTPSNLKAFLEVSHNPDGTIKSDGVNDPVIYAHNHDTNAHPNLSPIKRPKIVSPSDGATDFMGTVESSPYAVSDRFYGKHEASDWEISDQPDFSNVVYSSYDDTTNLTSLDVSGKGLQPSTTYYVRVRYKSMGHASLWSEPISFTTPANRAPAINSVSWNDDVLYDNKSYTVKINASDPDGDPLSYSVSCDDPNVEIKQDSSDSSIFHITFPDYKEDTTVNFTYTASDGIAESKLTESKTVLDFKEYIGVLSQDNNVFIRDVKTDSCNVFVCGYFYNGNHNVGFVAKLDNNLSLVKQVAIDSGSNLYLTGITIDSNGNVFVCGYTDSDIYVGKLDNGLALVKQITIATSGDNWIFCYDITIDSNGNVFVCGYKKDGSSYISYVARLDNELNSINKRTINSGSNLYLTDITIDSDGNVFVCGWIEHNDRDIGAIAKLDNNLSLVKQVAIDSGSNLYLTGITTDSDGNVFVCGRINNGSHNVGFIAKMDNNLGTAKQIAIDSEDGAIFVGITTDANGNIFVCGSYTSGHKVGFIVKMDNDFGVLAEKGLDSGVETSVLGCIVINDTLFVNAEINDSVCKGMVARLESTIPSGTFTATVGGYDFVYSDATLTTSDANFTVVPQTWSSTIHSWGASVPSWSLSEASLTYNRGELG